MQAFNKNSKFENVFTPNHIHIQLGGDGVPESSMPLFYYHYEKLHMAEKIAEFDFYTKYSAEDIVGRERMTTIGEDKREGLEMLVDAMVTLGELPLTKIIQNGEILYKRTRDSI